MRQGPTQSHKHEWEEELRIFDQTYLRICLFCPECKGRKEETIKANRSKDSGFGQSISPASMDAHHK
jgi:hypothetical protein